MTKSSRNSVNKFLLVIILSYFMVFIASFGVYSLQWLLSFFGDSRSWALQSVRWALVGLSYSLLASLCAWPFALSIATLLEQNKSHPLARMIFKVIRFLGSLPLVVFVFVYQVVISAQVFLTLENFWSRLFSPDSFISKLIAFATTLVFYPFTLLTSAAGTEASVDVFYKRTLAGVVQFADVGLVTSVVIVGLIFYILPQMILRMDRYLQQDQSLKHLEVIRSMGGSPWESIYLTVLQRMRERFSVMVLRFTRTCFFEGLLTFCLLRFFLEPDQPLSSYWGVTPAVEFIDNSMMAGSIGFPQATALAGMMCLIYLVFMRLESRAKLLIEGGYV